MFQPPGDARAALEMQQMAAAMAVQAGADRYQAEARFAASMDPLLRLQMSLNPELAHNLFQTHPGLSAQHAAAAAAAAAMAAGGQG